MYEPAPFRVLKADDAFSLLRLAASLAVETVRAELVQVQRHRALAEQAARNFDPQDLDRDPGR